jgi:hypothetical protein
VESGSLHSGELYPQSGACWHQGAVAASLKAGGDIALKESLYLQGFDGHDHTSDHRLIAPLEDDGHQWQAG